MEQATELPGNKGSFDLQNISSDHRKNFSNYQVLTFYLFTYNKI